MAEFAAFGQQGAWNENETAYRAGEQSGHLGNPNQCPPTLALSEHFWKQGYAYGVMMRGKLLPDNKARFPLSEAPIANPNQ